MADAEEKPQKNKKVNRMTLAEVESALKKSEEHMKGHTSQYARKLLERKEILSAK